MRGFKLDPQDARLYELRGCDCQRIGAPGAENVFKTGLTLEQLGWKGGTARFFEVG